MAAMASPVVDDAQIRGIADRDLPDALVVSIGRALVTSPDVVDRGANGRPRFVVSRDCRLSGERLFEALCLGLTQAGADVVDIGIGPTPQLFFALQHLGVDSGVMITGASEAPAVNGFKLIERGRYASAPRWRELLSEASDDAARLDVWQLGVRTEQFVAEHYLDALTRGFDIDPSIGPFVIDAGNGAAGPLGCEALRRLGLDPLMVNGTMNGKFPRHSPDPTDPQRLEALGRHVRQKTATIGIAWSGDGTGMSVVDAAGKVVPNQRLLPLFASRTQRESNASDCEDAIYATLRLLELESTQPFNVNPSGNK